MLSTIQERLSEIYDVQIEQQVDHFLCDLAVASAAAGPDVEARREALLVQDDPDGLSLGLYIDENTLARVRAGRDLWLDATTSAYADHESLAHASLATEGVSHFLYIAFRSDAGESVSLLELELQAEVDKYVCALLAGQTRDAHDRTSLLSGNGIGLMKWRRQSELARAALFTSAQFIHDAQTDEGARYRAAVRYADQYARQIERVFLQAGEADLMSELRRFYRRGLLGKLQSTRA